METASHETSGTIAFSGSDGFELSCAQILGPAGSSYGKNFY